MGKPLIFVASSSKAIDIAEAIRIDLRNDAEIELWHQGFFRLGQFFMECLESGIDKFDYAIFVLTKEDRAVSRDNVFIELGIFIGRIGRHRTFIVYEKEDDEKKDDLAIPSDLFGICLADYEKPEKATLEAALGPACTLIRQEIKKGRKSDSQLVSLSFDQIIKEYSETLERLKANDGILLKQIISAGDYQRLRDGLFSGLLYASRALVTGFVDDLFYGNLMEWDKEHALLRVKYFAGPYNEEVITREFPLEGKGKGVASIALSSGQIQIRNHMDQELRVPGEGRLQAMLEIPIEKLEDCGHGMVALLSVDSAKSGVFPESGTSDYIEFEKRIENIRKLLQQVNSIEQ